MKNYNKCKRALDESLELFILFIFGRSQFVLNILINQNVSRLKDCSNGLKRCASRSGSSARWGGNEKMYKWTADAPAWVADVPAWVAVAPAGVAEKDVQMGGNCTHM